jgi:hypothetical protein
MSLPKLETPTYELILPSTEEKIRFRPFLVKEYKVLLTALESDPEEIYRVVIDLIDVCTFNKLQVNTLPNFDVEYIFLNIRAKSVGENANLILTCTNCKSKIETSSDITKAKVKKNPEHSKKIKINDDISIEMRYPNFREIVAIQENANSEKIVDLICSCIDTILTKDKYYKLEEYSKEDISEFVNSFSKEQFDKLETFFATMPKLEQTIQETCANCSTVNTIVVEGLQNFFG